MAITLSFAPISAEAATTTWRASTLTRSERQRVLFESCNRAAVANRERCISRQKKKVSRRSARTQPYSAKGLYEKIDRGQKKLKQNLQAKMRAASRIEARKERRSWGRVEQSSTKNDNSSIINRRRIRQLSCMQETNRRLRSKCLDKTANAKRSADRSSRSGSE